MVPARSRLHSMLAGELRHLAHLGARYGPSWWLEHSPGPIGALAYVLASRHRRALETRLEWVLGRPPTRGELLWSFKNFAHCLAESLGSEARAVRFEIDGEHHVREIIRSERGFVLVTAHTGAWELAASCLGRDFARRVILVMEPEANARARAVHERVRTRHGVRALYAGRDPMLGLRLAEELGRGSVVALQLDRLGRSRRELVTRFCGRCFAVPEGPLRLARSAEVPIVPAFSSRVGYLHHQIRVYPPLRLSRAASADELERAAQSIVAAFEVSVSAHPLQWFDFELLGDRGGSDKLPCGA